ncbi:MAG: hypothetical protein ACKOX3_08680 [Bacteroidota bacterium]
MKTRLVIFLFLGLLMLFPSQSNAQVIGDAYIVNANPIAGNTQSVLNIVLTDTVNITSFMVKVGSIEGGQDLFSYVFTFDQAGGFPAGVGYSRNGYKVNCPLGNMVETPVYFTEITTTTGGNTTSAPFKFVSN